MSGIPSNNLAQRNGAIASVILAILFTLLSLIFTLLSGWKTLPLTSLGRKRWVIMVLQLIAVVCSIGGIVSFCLYKTDGLDRMSPDPNVKFKYDTGLYLTGVAAGAGLVGMLGLYWVQPSDDYKPVAT